MQPGIAPGSKIFNLLYADEHGEEVGLSEVQMLEPIPEDRLRDTEALLRHDDLFVCFQAALVLTAWGKDSGLGAIETFIRQEGRDGQNLSPHRIHGQDNRFDDMADAIRVYVMSEGDRPHAVEALRGLLKLYPRHFFESSLKWTLKGFTADNLGGDIRHAIEECRANGRPYQASQLLPVLAKADPEACWQLLPLFANEPAQVPDPAVNVAEALAYLDKPESIEMLKRYLTSTSPGVAETARESLDMKSAAR